jgi:hypothetical protein
VANDTNLSFGFSVVDALGIRASCTVYGKGDSTLVLSDQITQAQALATALAGVTDGLITEGEIRIRFTPTVDQSTKPVAGSEVERTEVSTFAITGASGKTFGVDVPAWSTSLITDGKPVVDSGAGATWVGALTGSYTGGVMTNNTYQALGALARSFLSFRKRRKQLFRESLVGA